MLRKHFYQKRLFFCSFSAFLLFLFFLPTPHPSCKKQESCILTLIKREKRGEKTSRGGSEALSRAPLSNLRSHPAVTTRGGGGGAGGGGGGGCLLSGSDSLCFPATSYEGDQLWIKSGLLFSSSASCSLSSFSVIMWQAGRCPPAQVCSLWSRCLQHFLLPSFIS